MTIVDVPDGINPDFDHVWPFFVLSWVLLRPFLTTITSGKFNTQPGLTSTRYIPTFFNKFVLIQNRKNLLTVNLVLLWLLSDRHMYTHLVRCCHKFFNVSTSGAVYYFSTVPHRGGGNK